MSGQDVAGPLLQTAANAHTTYTSLCGCRCNGGSKFSASLALSFEPRPGIGAGPSPGSLVHAGGLRGDPRARLEMPSATSFCLSSLSPTLGAPLHLPASSQGDRHNANRGGDYFWAIRHQTPPMMPFLGLPSPHIKTWFDYGIRPILSLEQLPLETPPERTAIVAWIQI